MRTAIAALVVAALLINLAPAVPYAHAGQIEMAPQQGSEQQFKPPSQLPGQNGAPPLTIRKGNIQEIPLPKVFRGCWSGSVASLDSVQPLQPAAARLVWLTKNYTICYKQIGYKGNWQLTFADSSVADQRWVSDQRQAVKIQSVDGANRATLSAYLHFKVRSTDRVTRAITIRTLDETSQLQCEVVPERNLMSVKAETAINSDGEPFANLTWHTFFSHSESAGG